MQERRSMSREAETIKNIGDFLREKGFKATIYVPKEKPAKRQEPPDLTELTQKDN